MSLRIYVTRIDAPSEGGRLLLLAAEKAGSLAALAEIIGVHRVYIGKWIRGKHKPSAQFRNRLVPHGVPQDTWELPPRRPFSLAAHAA
jgi:transcriptional regulator with XRE-family HTH domain